MARPWTGPRHKSWASDTVLMTVVLLALITATVITDVIGEPPTYLTGLLGTAAGVFFAAIGSDRNKRDDDVARQAKRAEDKADTLGEIAVSEHPETINKIPPPSGTKASP